MSPGLLCLRLDLSRGLLAEPHELRLGLYVVAELLVAILVYAAAGMAARGALLGVRELHVRVYSLDHRFFVGREGGAGLDVPSWDAVVAHPAEPGAPIGVYDVLAVLRLGQRDLDVEEAVGEHHHVDGVLHSLDAELLAQVPTLLLPDAGHSELADLLPVVSQVICGPDHLVEDDPGPRRGRLPFVPRRSRQPEPQRQAREEERQLRETVDFEPFHNERVLPPLTRTSL